MKGKIDAYHYLHIERAGVMGEASCPFKDGFFCGDWCALFGEPEKEKEAYDAYDESGVRREYIRETGFSMLPLCHRTLTFTEFSDEREKS